MWSKVICHGKVIRSKFVRWAKTVKFASFKKLEVWLEPSLVYWDNVRTFHIFKRSKIAMKVKGVKGHVRSICKIAWKFKIWLICKFTCVGSRRGVNLHYPQTATAGSISMLGPQNNLISVFASRISLEL